MAVADYARVRRGDLLVEIVDDDYRAQVAQAEANLDGAAAAIVNNLAQQALQAATIRAAEALVRADVADLKRDRLERARQLTLVQTAASSRQTFERADADEKRMAATVDQAQAQAEAQRRQLDVLKTQARQLEASRDAARAQLDLARISLSYTRIAAPADGIVGERQVRTGQLVSAGSQVIALIPAPDVWVIANFRETQLFHVHIGQPATVMIDAYPGLKLHGRVETLAPASGSQFALLPPDNATGNFTKVVQRVSVKIALDPHGLDWSRLRPGLSVIARIDTGDRP